MDSGSRRRTRSSTQAATRASIKAKKSRIAYSPKDLYNAIIDRNKDKIFEILAQKQPKVNLQTIYDTVEDNSFPTALHLIFLYFNESDILEILESFLDENFILDEADEKGRTILHLAVLNRMKKAIEFLIKRNAKVSVHDQKGNFITHYFVTEEFKKFDKKLYTDNSYDKKAIEEETISFVEWLISKGFNFDYENRIEVCALDLAIDLNLQHILPTLLNHTSDIIFVNKINKQTLLHAFIAAKNKYKEKRIGYYCLNRKVWTQDFTKRYDIEIVKILLDNDVSVDNVDRLGQTALHLAIERKVEIDIVEMLLERFTDIDKKYYGMTLLRHIITFARWQVGYEYYMKMIQALIAKGAILEHEDHIKVMHGIIQTRSLQAIKLMKDIGVCINMKMDKGQNLLHEFAAHFKMYYETTSDLDDKTQVAIFDFLVNEGCGIDDIDDKGMSPLHEACRRGNAVIARKLIAHGADINRREKSGQNTPLHFAAGRDKLVEVAELLSDMGADVNSKNSYHERPLYISISNETNQMAKMLLTRGAYVDVQTDAKDTALSRAICDSYPASVEELLKYGASMNHPNVAVVLNLNDCERRLHLNESWNRYCLPHWMKLKAINVPLNMYVDFFIESKDDEYFREKYLKEVKRLKSTSIDSRTSLYDFLHMNVNSRCIHINNEKFLKIINSELFEKYFPQYYILILGSYREAIARKSLLRPAIKSWIELTNIDLPDICIESIFSYLSNADLVVIIEKQGTVSEGF